MKNLEENYQKNRVMADRLSRYKKDPSSHKYVLYGCLVFEGGRYRPAGEKYYSMTRASSKSSVRSSSKTIRSLSNKSSFRDLQATEKILYGEAKVGFSREPSSKKSIRSRDSQSQSIVGGRKFKVEYVGKVHLPKTASNGTQLHNHNGSRATKASEKETPRSLHRKNIVRTARADQLPRIARPGQPSTTPLSQRSTNLFMTRDQKTHRQRRESVGDTGLHRLNRTVEEHPASREQSVSTSQHSVARNRARLERSLQ